MKKFLFSLIGAAIFFTACTSGVTIAPKPELNISTDEVEQILLNSPYGFLDYGNYQFPATLSAGKRRFSF